MTRILAIFFLLIFSLSSFAQNKVFIDVGKAHVRKSLLAFPLFQNLGSDKSSKSLKAGQNLYDVIRNDLDVSGLFAFIKEAAFLEDTQKVGLRPAPGSSGGFSFSSWKEIGAEFLVRGGYQVIKNEIHLEIYVYYVPQAKLVIGKKYKGPTSVVRKLAHTFANDLVVAVTGKESFFKNRIVVAVDDGPRSHREIQVMDWDGANGRPITKHESITISPAWSRDGQHVAYTAFVERCIPKGKQKCKIRGKKNNALFKKNPDLYIYEMNTSKRWLVSYRDGLNSGAEFLPSGKELLVTLSQGKTADIYRMSLDGKKIKPLTRGPGRAMNVEPSISPDGKKIAFSSDRSGKPTIYTMNIDGTGIKRLTSIGHYNSTPTWSTDGKKIAFAGLDKQKKNFDIFILNANGSGIERLTSARKPNGRWANNEDPAFSPDGRHVLFVSDRTGTRQLHIVGIDGSNERRITFDKRHYHKPKWGPPAP